MTAAAAPAPSSLATGLVNADKSYAYKVILFAIATLADQRDSDTESHLIRVQHYTRLLAQQLTTHPEFADTVSPAGIEQLMDSIPLYDLGTVGVPDRVLLKPGRLTTDELAIMRTHPKVGFDALVRAEKTLGQTASWLTVAKELVLSHQEKWDGTGYPQGLKGNQIPASARIVALADVYDALISNKVYKDGVPHDAAVGIIFSERGAHFDPDVVDAFMTVHEKFADIARHHADTDADMQRKIEYMANAIAEQAVL